MTYRGERKLRSIRLESVFMTRKDWRDFAAALSREFPRLRYLDDDYWADFLDRVAMARRDERLRRVGERPSQDVIMRNPGRSPPLFFRMYPPGRYVSRTTEAWQVPVGWRARWSLPDTRGYRRIVNAPGEFLEIADSANIDSAAGYGGNLEERESLWRSKFRGYWSEGSQEGRQFVRRAFRILARETTGHFLALDRKTLQPVSGQPKSMPGLFAGRDAVAWVESSPNHYCEGHVRPVWIEKPTRLARTGSAARFRHGRTAARPESKRVKGASDSSLRTRSPAKSG